MTLRRTIAWSLGFCLFTSLSAQSLSESFKAQRGAWEQMLERGEAAAVRKSAEGMLAKDGLAVNPANYNDMQSLVSLRSLVAKACVSDGAWEDAVEQLQKAQSSAQENLSAAETTFAKLKTEHEARIKASKVALEKYQPTLKQMDEAPGLGPEQIKQRRQLKIFVDEHLAAVKHSEESLKTMDTILASLRVDKDSCTKSLADWQSFLAKEKADVASMGSEKKFVSEKLEQVKGDDARSRSERLAYARRLARLDPTNKDVTRLVNGLLGREEEPAPPPAKKGRKK
jgi:chromosome segregation ATPase